MLPIMKPSERNVASEVYSQTRLIFGSSLESMKSGSVRSAAILARIVPRGSRGRRKPVEMLSFSEPQVPWPRWEGQDRVKTLYRCKCGPEK